MYAVVRRLDEHEDRAVHMVDIRTQRGLILHYCDEWDLVRVQDLSDVEWQRMVHPSNGYTPMEIPDDEFNKLYNNCKLRGLLSRKIGNDFDPSKTPVLRNIIEENDIAYAQRVTEAVKQVRRILSSGSGI